MSSSGRGRLGAAGPAQTEGLAVEAGLCARLFRNREKQARQINLPCLPVRIYLIRLDMSYSPGLVTVEINLAA